MHSVALNTVSYLFFSPQMSLQEQKSVLKSMRRLRTSIPFLEVSRKHHEAACKVDRNNVWVCIAKHGREAKAIPGPKCIDVEDESDVIVNAINADPFLQFVKCFLLADLLSIIHFGSDNFCQAEKLTKPMYL